MKLPQRITISNFLQEVKKTITNPLSNYQSWVLVRRRKTLNCVLQLGFNYRDIHSVILGLSVTDYCQGPVQDRRERGDLWIFGKAIGDKEIYIKIKLATFGALKMVRIISFHFANEPLCYPCKEEGEREDNHEER